MTRFENYGKHICISWYSKVLLALFCRVCLLIIVPEPIIHLLHRFFVHAWKDVSMDSQSDTELREYIPDRRACQKTLAEVQSVPSACLRNSCLIDDDASFPPPGMHFVEVLRATIRQRDSRVPLSLPRLRAQIAVTAVPKRQLKRQLSRWK
jgi:hypothetical protein